ncbi:uncharacterized protein [Engystomops pustulosus]|uniref:uncharacterized protein n=1 Tax=Engystomops pustulosus TaxID=76066 RepID=UPI003AFA7200
MNREKWLEDLEDQPEAVAAAAPLVGRHHKDSLPNVCRNHLVILVQALKVFTEPGGKIHDNLTVARDAGQRIGVSQGRIFELSPPEDDTRVFLMKVFFFFCGFCLFKVTQNYEHLFGRLADSIPLSAKHHIWQGITVRINGLGVEYRSVPEVRKKWYDCRRRLKAKLAKHKQSARRTGGGPSVAMRMSWVEQKINQTIHPDLTEGIGDFDTDDLDVGRAAPPAAPQAAPPPANEAAPGPPCASPATPPAVVSLGGSSGDEAPEVVPAEDRPITLGIFSNYMDKSLEAMGLIQRELQRHGRMMEEGFQLISGDLRALINILGLLIHQGTVAQGGSVSVPPFSPPQVPTGGDPVTQASPAPKSQIQLPTDQDSGCSYAPLLAGALDPSPVALGPSPEATFLLSVKEELRSSASNPPGTSGSSVVTRRQAKRGKGPVRRSSRSSKP